LTANNNVVKITAKTALKGKWLNSIVAVLTIIFSFFIGVLSTSFLDYVFGGTVASIFFCLYALFLLFPLFMGALRYFWHLISGDVLNPVSVFYYFSEKVLFIKSLSFLFHLFLKFLPIALLIFLPVVFVWFIAEGKLFSVLDIPLPMWTADLNYVYKILRPVSAVVFSLIALKYYMSPFLLVADENMAIDEAIYMSKVISRKTLIDFIYLIFCFIGWYLLSLFIFPMIYTLPYALTAYCVHCRFAVADYNKHLKQSFEESLPTYSVGI